MSLTGRTALSLQRPSLEALAMVVLSLEPATATDRFWPRPVVDDWQISTLSSLPDKTTKAVCN